jgi:hypothetical protein
MESTPSIKDIPHELIRIIVLSLEPIDFYFAILSCEMFYKSLTPLDVKKYRKSKRFPSFKYYSKNRPFKERRFLPNGRQDGIERRYYGNGKLDSIYYWSNGRQNGFERYYHANGRLHCEYHWTDGKKDGKFQTWYENGEKHEFENWEKGFPKGQHMKWTREGKVIQQNLCILGTWCIPFDFYSKLSYFWCIAGIFIYLWSVERL